MPLTMATRIFRYACFLFDRPISMDYTYFVTEVSALLHGPFYFQFLPVPRLTHNMVYTFNIFGPDFKEIGEHADQNKSAGDYICNRTAYWLC